MHDFIAFLLTYIDTLLNLLKQPSKRSSVKILTQGQNHGGSPGVCVRETFSFLA